MVEQAFYAQNDMSMNCIGMEALGLGNRFVNRRDGWLSQLSSSSSSRV